MKMLMDVLPMLLNCLCDILSWQKLENIRTCKQKVLSNSRMLYNINGSYL